jgi:hypothetical protein
MIPEILVTLASSLSVAGVESLLTAIKKYRDKKGVVVTITDSDYKELKIRDDGSLDDSLIYTKAKDLDDLTRVSQYYKSGDKESLKELFQELFLDYESPIDASHTTREVITEQVTILEQERNRLIPIAAREHWVAIIFAIIAGLVFFTGIVLVILSTITKGVVTLIATTAPGFLSKVFYSREATIEKRLREISADLRESEKTKERLEIVEAVLKVIPEDYREKVLGEFIKTGRSTTADTYLRARNKKANKKVRTPTPKG